MKAQASLQAGRAQERFKRYARRGYLLLNDKITTVQFHRLLYKKFPNRFTSLYDLFILNSSPGSSVNQPGSKQIRTAVSVNLRLI